MTRGFLLLLVLATSQVASPSSAQAEDVDFGRPTQTSFRLRTYARLFGRSQVLGPAGSIVTETSLPVTEHVSYWAGDIDTLFGHDTAELEVSGYQSVDPASEGRSESDLQTASLTLRSSSNPRHVWLSLGRQVSAGGAARFSRFDGATLGFAPAFGLSLRAYGGYRVLPRFDQTPGYHHLGAAPDVLESAPLLFEPLDRSKYSVLGGDARLHTARFDGALSIHDETDGGAIGRRNLGLDATAHPFDDLDLGTSVLLDLDSFRWSNLRLFVDYFATKKLDLGVQFIRAEPALLLSRQSVLSVFSTASYREFGGSLRYRLLQSLSASGSAWLQDYDDSGPGARMTAELRASKNRGPFGRVFTFGYTRVDTPESGYHSLRALLSQELNDRTTATAQSFVYFYDEAIAGQKTSLTEAVTLDYDVAPKWNMLVGASLAKSPYATLDASAQVRLSYAIHQGGGLYR